MSDKISFKSSCSVCEHRDVCKYYCNGICGEFQAQLEQVANLIPELFIVSAVCKHYK